MGMGLGMGMGMGGTGSAPGSGSGSGALSKSQLEELEEGCRRGGVMGVAGKVWKWEGGGV
jgi:hypothetical protein